MDTFKDSEGAANTPRDTFVIRIWSSDEANLLRGHVQHVRSRKRAYFASEQRLLDFIQDQLSERTRCQP